MSGTDSAPLKHTPLYPLHVELGARMAPFAGYEMPVHYGQHIITEHLFTRAQAGLFDLSHMGQVRLEGADPAVALETLVPGDIAGLEPYKTRYTLFTNEDGGILDDLMVTNAGDHLFLVVNAACTAQDIAHMTARLDGNLRVRELSDRALLALQGPAAAEVLARFAPGCRDTVFLTAAELTIDGTPCFVTRCGYTGEDGFEISTPAGDAVRIARLLLDQPEVKPAGLGARDSLRLEAGFCLYGHDIDASTTPVEAGLAWTIPRRRRSEGGFPGVEVILRQLANGVERKRVGIRPGGRAPARAHTEIQDPDGNKVGEITSGGFGPTVGGPIAMGYVAARVAAKGSALRLMLRGTPRPAHVAALPFVEPRYYGGPHYGGPRRGAAFRQTAVLQRLSGKRVP